MEKKFHFFFTAWINSTKETSVILKMKQKGKVVSEQKITVETGTIKEEMIAAVRAFKGDWVLDIEVYSLTNLRRGKPDMVCCGVVFDEMKAAIAQYKEYQAQIA